MIVALLVSTGAAWESAALASLSAHPGVVLLKRCVDLADLLAAASTGQADVAVVGADLVGLDRDVIDQLLRHGVRPVGITSEAEHTRARAGRIGLDTLVDAALMADLGATVAALPADLTAPSLDPAPTAAGRSVLPPPAPPVASLPEGRVIAVWGPAGAPGRTTLATAVAGELARQGLDALLVDADPHGGAVAQQLGILDEVSGLLAAARLVAAGSVAERFGSTQRRLSDRLRVLTGLPRPDRWVEVRPGVVTDLVEAGRRGAHVVVDTGFSLEADPDGDLRPGRPGRNDLTREVLESADEVLLVGVADPVGLARLARAVVELEEFLPGAEVRVVVNRMRPTLGWRESDVVTMLRGFGRPRSIHFLPEDQPAVDRALVAGRLLVESGDSALTRAVSALVAELALTR